MPMSRDWVVTFKAATASNLVGAKQLLTQLTTNDNEVTRGAGLTGEVVGVLYSPPESDGANCAVQVYGVARVRAGASVSIGDRVGSDGSGRGITAGTGGNNFVGIAISAAGAADEVFDVLLGRGTV